ncbi:helix-turn-helix domain-containing protein [Candidatus Poribacteria bacterium]
MSALGKIIKLHRTRAGMKQKDLAERLGVSSSYLSLIESCKREPSIALVEQISKELGVPVSYMFWQTHDRPKDLPKDQQRLWDLMTDLLWHFQELSAQSREASGDEHP